MEAQEKNSNAMTPPAATTLLSTALFLKVKLRAPIVYFVFVTKATTAIGWPELAPLIHVQIVRFYSLLWQLQVARDRSSLIWWSGSAPIQTHQ